MAQTEKTPDELRRMFGDNLRALSAPYASISELSRQLGINRTQYNRYLAGESFPRPDVLARICRFFKVDARVLLEPVTDLPLGGEPITTGFLRDYLGKSARNVTPGLFPSGFYRFSRFSFTLPEKFVSGVVRVHRQGPHTYLRGYEDRGAMRALGFPDDARTRQFRGLVLQYDDGVSAVVSSYNAMSTSFNYLTKAAAYEPRFWQGYVTRTIPETVAGSRASRLVYEYLGPAAKDALPAARLSGFMDRADLPPFHARLLRPDAPFS
ncbi:MAG: helix-turn-helix domain-containing protein [Sulfitobacter sp.]